MIAPGIFAGPSAAGSNNAANSGAVSWRKSPFRFKNFDSIKLGANDLSKHGENYEFHDTETSRAAGAWVAGGKEIPQANINIVSGPIVRGNKSTKVRDKYNSPSGMTDDATSEEWIMMEGSSK
jgi:hypothetical protein